MAKPVKQNTYRWVLEVVFDRNRLINICGYFPKITAHNFSKSSGMPSRNFVIFVKFSKAFQSNL